MHNFKEYESKANDYAVKADVYWNQGDTENSLKCISNEIKMIEYIIENGPKYFKDIYAGRYQATLLKYNERIDFINKGGKPKPKPKAGAPSPGHAGSPPAGGNHKAVSQCQPDQYKDALSGAIVTEKPNIKWDDVSGLETAKQALKEAVILPIRFPAMFEDGLIKPWKGILLYGPPGTGKTFLAKACATQADAQFFSISSSDLISKYVGQSEKLIRALFDMARAKKPSIIFIDEIDSMCGSRDDSSNQASKRVITEFLVQMQGVGHDDTGVLVLGATNLPWGLDAAIRRRFERRIFITLPEPEARRGMLISSFGKSKGSSFTKEDIEELVELTDGYSGSDISVLVKKAAYLPLKRMQMADLWVQNERGKFEPCDKTNPGAVKKKLMDFKNEELEVPKLTARDIKQSLKSCKPSVDKAGLKKYTEFTEKFGEASED